MKKDLLREVWGKISWSALRAGPFVCMHQCWLVGDLNMLPEQEVAVSVPCSIPSQVFVSCVKLLRST